MTEILQKTQKAKEILQTNAEAIAAVAPKQPNTPDPAATLSNTNLLLDTLLAFYADTEKAAYFPFVADSAIRGLLDQFHQRLNEFIGNRHPTHASNILTVSDQLYSTSLQFGLITFGFPQKELGELVADLRSRRKSVRKIAESIEMDAAAVLSKAEECARSANGKFTQDTDTLRGELETAIKKCTERQEQLAQDSEVAAKAREELTAQHAALAEMSKQLAERHEKTLALADEVADNARTSKTEVDAIKDNRSRAKDEMEQIRTFYGEIEDHQKAMRDLHKEASAKHNELAQEFEKQAVTLRQRTDEIVTRNEGLLNDIQSHLRKAVGVSLFTAFDQRRKGLWWGKWAWATVLLAAVTAGAWLSWWLAESIKQGNGSFEPAFFVKLSAVIPVSFAILFAARQYSNERRTEEEYAFKSAISVSLEPYKDLLERMKQNGHTTEAGFVEKLLLEVFDNPVRRIYSEGTAAKDDTSTLFDIPEVKKLLVMAKDTDPDKVRKMVELIGDVIGRPLTRAEGT